MPISITITYEQAESLELILHEERDRCASEIESMKGWASDHCDVRFWNAELSIVEELISLLDAAFPEEED